ncbi:MAG: hypothetical protein IMW96_06830 [Thermoanaerobacteraceae bacterium]|nr:hypothetical protein [Thermoanaerobacteraceae bacterium]
MGERGILGVTDTSEYLWIKEPQHLPISTGVTPGHPVQEGTVAGEAIRTGKRVERQVTRETSRFGVGYYGMAVPVFDRGKVVGAINFILPTGIQDRLREISAQLVDFSSKVHNAMGDIAGAAAELATSAAEMTEYSTELQEGMKVLEEVIMLVRGVADKTHLLSLNAAIEAARAAEHGRGFGVVAVEVRKLAERVKQSVIQMESRIKHMTSIMEGIVERVGNLNAMSQNQAAASEEINTMVAILNQAAKEIDEVAPKGCF